MTHDGTEMTALASFVDNGTTPRIGGVLRSFDSGVIWGPSSSGLPAGVQVTDLSASPFDPMTFFLADQAGGGVFRTTDGGSSWWATGFESAALHVECDPHQPDVVFITRDDSEQVLWSQDGGGTFATFNEGLSIAGAIQDLTFTNGEETTLLLATGTGAYSRRLGMTCAADIARGDGFVNLSDILVVLQNWGPCASEDCPGDIVTAGPSDGVVDFNDLFFVLANWGTCP